MLIPSELGVLVIDDNGHAGALAKQELKRVGMVDIHVVTDVISALEAIKDNTIHFVLLDWYMPEINGAGFVRMVRQGLSHCESNLPIIVTTAYATRESTARMRELGLREILVKPYNAKQLGKAISIAIAQLANNRPDSPTKEQGSTTDSEEPTEQFLL